MALQLTNRSKVVSNKEQSLSEKLYLPATMLYNIAAGIKLSFFIGVKIKKYTFPFRFKNIKSSAIKLFFILKSSSLFSNKSTGLFSPKSIEKLLHIML